MPRAATTSDVFNAVAEPCRREILGALAVEECSVGDLVGSLQLSQPVVSKHLAVLRAVRLVDVRNDGRRRVYRLVPTALLPMEEWLAGFRHLWSARLDRFDDVLAELRDDHDRRTAESDR
ncbi:ArsR/SmtB family transcription factor [Microlunatus speluncae]|uniref:ArsR/SmtB family transcription factor n=1 Tax=Microlunatus speluncae TaxID=2594267 RepID=UPI0012668485|nr:metalloregulator ArsR/SmtB family transcription factor [Microlunatus speluncae]